MRCLCVIVSVCLAANLCLAGSALYVDDNGQNDPGPGDPLVSDPAEDGSEAHPFDAIQQAIEAAANGDEVIILPGTYTGVGNRDIDFKGKAITVRGRNPEDPNVVAATIIDCQGTQAEPHRGFHFHSGETETSVLKGLTITNGYGLLEVDVFGPNSGSYVVGGGIFCKAASPYCSELVISDSGADRGGGILSTMANPKLTRCNLLRNTATGGGGMYFYEGYVQLDTCTISNNETTVLGGAGYLIKGAVSIEHSSIATNRSRLGAGLYAYECEINLEDVIISANVATSSGGGTYLRNCLSGSHLRNCLFSGNYSKSSGGGIYVETSFANFSNCTIAGNRAGADGGGIYAEAGSSGGFGAGVELRDSIVWGNRAARGNQIACETNYDGGGHGNAGLWYSDIEDGMDGTFFDATFGPRVHLMDGTVDADPLFADPGRWDDNGTPDDMSDDKWIDGDYHLKSYAGRWDPTEGEWVLDDAHSPCIDAGDPASDFSAEPWWSGGRINMGAYGNTAEASRSGACIARPAADLNNDCRVNLADLALLTAHWLDCNLDPPTACE